MTITHEEQIALQASGRSLAKTAATAFVRAFGTIHTWHLNAAQRRQVGQLTPHLQCDVGEIDQLPLQQTHFGEPTSYQDRLEQKWMR